MHEAAVTAMQERISTITSSTTSAEFITSGRIATSYSTSCDIQAFSTTRCK
jgi:hypothetical protein